MVVVVVVVVAACWLHWKKEERIEPLHPPIFLFKNKGYVRCPPNMTILTGNDGLVKPLEETSCFTNANVGVVSGKDRT